HEHAAVETCLARQKLSSLAPPAEVSERDSVIKIAPDHLAPAVGQVLLMEALGTRDPEFLAGLLEQLANSGTRGRKGGRERAQFHASGRMAEISLGTLCAPTSGHGPGVQIQERSLQLLVRRSQPVTDPGLRQYVLRALGVGFDLLPQLPHVDPQVLRVGQIIPELAEYELVGQHLAGMLHQYAQKLVLFGR